MAVLAKPINKMVRISPEESVDFVKRFNASVITKEQLSYIFIMMNNIKQKHISSSFFIFCESFFQHIVYVINICKLLISIVKYKQINKTSRREKYL